MITLTACSCLYIQSKCAYTLSTAVVIGTSVVKKKMGISQLMWKNRKHVTREIIYTIPFKRKKHINQKKNTTTNLQFWRSKMCCFTKTIAKQSVHLRGVPAYWGTDTCIPQLVVTGMFFPDTTSTSGISHSLQFNAHGIVTHIWKGDYFVSDIFNYRFNLPQPCFDKLPQQVQFWLLQRNKKQSRLSAETVCLCVQQKFMKNVTSELWKIIQTFVV